ncbi:MAG: hypothetical protein FWE76_05585 [Symbiobacteriaceae bacterium]|nr:hypothetical protein [Symbiobacteriaceae bacterium]
MKKRRGLQVFIENMETLSLREIVGAITREGELMLAKMEGFLTPLPINKVSELYNELALITDDDSPAYKNLSSEYLAGVQQMALMMSVEMMRDILFRAKSQTNSNIMPNANPFDLKASPWFWYKYPFQPSLEGVEALKECIGLLPTVSEFDFTTCHNYFSGEFRSKAETTIETVKAVVTQMTAFFASSERIANSFSPGREKLNFLGFEEAIREGKIVVLAMNVAEYPKVSQTVAAYLKLDFQAEIIQRTSKGRYATVERPMFFLCDEYQEFVTSKDGNFYGISREAKCCSIVASQSCTSLLKALGGDRPSFETLYQNLISKITLRSDDRLTIEMMQLLIGKTDKTHISKNVSESAADSQKSAFIGGLVSSKASLSESISVSTQRVALFEEKDFTQTLQAHKAIAFLARTDGMQEPTMIHLLPYFKPPILNLGKDEM